MASTARAMLMITPLGIRKSYDVVVGDGKIRHHSH